MLLCNFSDLNDVQSITDPLSKVQAGLLSKSDQPVPLKAVHVRAKLLDLAAEVRSRNLREGIWSLFDPC